MATNAKQASKLEGQAYGLSGSGEGKPIETVEIPDLPNGGGTNSVRSKRSIGPYTLQGRGTGLESTRFEQREKNWLSRFFTSILVDIGGGPRR